MKIDEAALRAFRPRGLPREGALMKGMVPHRTGKGSDEASQGGYERSHHDDVSKLCQQETPTQSAQKHKDEYILSIHNHQMHNIRDPCTRH